MRETFRERLAALSRRELTALVALCVVLVAGAALWYVRSLPRPVEVRALRTERAPAEPSASPVVLIVHVAGAVRHPGVFEFAQGDRVIDAVQAAGGPTGKAALDALNLAAPLTDGQQIVVPREPPPGWPPSAPPGSPGGPTGVLPSTAPALVNVNTAGLPELETLPGVGPVLAQSIVDYRTEHGPFASVEGLLEVSGIGPATLEEIRDLVTI